MGPDVRAGGRAPAPGERWRNPGAAPDPAADRRRSGAEDFYHGEIAQAIAAHAAATGGLITAADLAGHTCTWVEPIAVGYRGHEVWEMPPNGQGIAALHGAEHPRRPRPRRLPRGGADTSRSRR